MLVYKRGAKTHGRSFELSSEKFLELTSSNCHYCGQPPHQILDRKKYTGRGNGSYTYNGIDRIDRIDSDKGYVDGNCVSCCRMCNYAKSDMKYEEFVKWFNRAVKFRN